MVSFWWILFDSPSDLRRLDAEMDMFLRLVFEIFFILGIYHALVYVLYVSTETMRQPQQMYMHSSMPLCNAFVFTNQFVREGRAACSFASFTGCSNCDNQNIVPLLNTELWTERLSKVFLIYFQNFFDILSGCISTFVHIWKLNAQVYIHH